MMLQASMIPSAAAIIDNLLEADDSILSFPLMRVVSTCRPWQTPEVQKFALVIPRAQ